MVTLNSDGAGGMAAVDERTMQLMAEFEQHFHDTIELDPSTEGRRELVFHAWTFQKLAGLQLCVEEIVLKFNEHVDAS
jgi:hypothetical protein